MAEKLLRQDRRPVWAASQNFADVQKRLGSPSTTYTKPSGSAKPPKTQPNL